MVCAHTTPGELTFRILIVILFKDFSESGPSCYLQECSSVSFLRKRIKVEPAWVYRAKGLVWRVVSAGTSMLVGEDRSPEDKRVTFFGLNRITGEVLWENVSFDEPWWISIEATCGDRVFLHGFARPDMPDHQRILALDLPTGRVAWSKDDMRYVSTAGDSVFTSKDTVTGRLIFELHRQTGETVQTWDNDAAGIRAAQSRAASSPEEGPEFPVPLTDVLSTDQRLGPVQKLSQDDRVVGQIEVILKGNLCMFSYHEKNAAGLLRNILGVVHGGSGERVFSETLSENVQSVVPDSFFLQGGILYFVRERSWLTAVNIAGLLQ